MEENSIPYFSTSCLQCPILLPKIFVLKLIKNIWISPWLYEVRDINSHLLQGGCMHSSLPFFFSLFYSPGYLSLSPVLESGSDL